jgi:hypothetical protein
MHEIEQGDGLFVFQYFASFYIVAVWVYFNLFIAVVLGNFQLNFLPEDISISEETLEHAKTQWVALSDESDGPSYDTMVCSRIRSFAPSLMAPLGTDVVNDPLWYNRLLFELSVDPAKDHQARVSFHEVLLALSLVHETYDSLSFSQLMARNEVLRLSKEDVASRIIVATAKRWCVHHILYAPPVMLLRCSTIDASSCILGAQADAAETALQRPRHWGKN